MFNKQYGALAIDEAVPNFSCFLQENATIYDYLPVKVIRYKCKYSAKFNVE